MTERKHNGVPFWWPRLLLIVLAAVSGGCPHDPATELYARQRPASKDLVGTYRLKSQSLNGQAVTALTSPTGLAPGPCTIALGTDGVLEYRHLPIWAGNWANGTDQWSVQEFRSGSGRWEIDAVGSTRDASGVVQLYGLTLTDASLADSVMILGTKPPYEIALGYGDPDGGAAMLFEIVPE